MGAGWLRGLASFCGWHMVCVVKPRLKSRGWFSQRTGCWFSERNGFCFCVFVVATGRAVCQVTGVQGLWQFCLDRGQPRVAHVYGWSRSSRRQPAAKKHLPVAKLQDPRWPREAERWGDNIIEVEWSRCCSRASCQNQKSRIVQVAAVASLERENRK